MHIEQELLDPTPCISTSVKLSDGPHTRHLGVRDRIPPTS